MALLQILFGFEGRLGRLAYLGYGVLAFLAVVLLFLLGSFLIPIEGRALVFGCIAPFALWASFALQAKRLHDLGFSGRHVIWIQAIGIGAGVMPLFSPTLAMIGAFVIACVNLWLFLAPGQTQPNQYG